MTRVPATYWSILWGKNWTVEGEPIPFLGWARKGMLTAYRFGPILILKVKIP